MMNELDFRFNPTLATHIHVSDNDSAYRVMELAFGSSICYHAEINRIPGVNAVWTGDDCSYALEYVDRIELVTPDARSIIIWKDNVLTHQHAALRAALNIPATVVERVGSLHHCPKD